MLFLLKCGLCSARSLEHVYKMRACSDRICAFIYLFSFCLINTIVCCRWHFSMGLSCHSKTVRRAKRTIFQTVGGTFLRSIPSYFPEFQRKPFRHESATRPIEPPPLFASNPQPPHPARKQRRWLTERVVIGVLCLHVSCFVQISLS